MDDLSPELRSLAESARAESLTRRDKLRLWSKLENAIADDRARSKLTHLLGRARALPGVARYAAAALCLAGLTLAVEAGVPRLGDPAPSVHVASTGSPVELAQPSRDATQPEPAAKRASRVSESATAQRTARSATRARVRSDPRAQEPTVLASLDEQAALRLQPARTRLLAPNAEPEGTSSAKAVGAGKQPTARSGTETARVLADLEAFREKLVAENYARYQAALAEHARTASTRRGPSSVGGYAAW